MKTKEIERKNKDTKTKKYRLIISAIIILCIVIATIILILNDDNINININIDKKFIDVLSSDKYYLKCKEVDENFEQVGLITDISRNEQLYVMSNDEITEMLDENFYYHIVKSQKTALKSDIDSNTTNLKSENSKITGRIKSSRVCSLNSVDYNCVEYDTITVYYINETAKYVKIKDKMIELIEYSAEPKIELFKIPTDYTILETK